MPRRKRPAWEPPTADDPRCWVWWRNEWLPGEWIRTVSRGKRAGWYVCTVGFKRTQRTVHPDAVKERK